MTIVASLFTLQLFSFSVFEGFATLANDSFSFIRVAKIWSPYSEASSYVLNTVPEHHRSPFFPWLLALTGGAESMRAGHLLTSIALLLSFSVIGAMLLPSVDGRLAILFATCLLLLPGVLLATMGVLSENVYLFFTLLAILVFWRVDKMAGIHAGSFILLLSLLIIASLTRAIGIALPLALLVSALLDGNRVIQKRAAYLSMAAVSLGAWFLWNELGVDPRASGVLDKFLLYLGDENVPVVERARHYSAYALASARNLPAAWAQYLGMDRSGTLLFVFSYLVFAVCLTATAYRAFKARMDAVYIIFYLAILIFWGYSGEQARFLHPVAWLMLLQPILLGALHAKPEVIRWQLLVIASFAVLLVNSLWTHHQFRALRETAERQFPALVHSFEYYENLGRPSDLQSPLVFQRVMVLMRSTSSIVPEDAVVASVKHEAFMLLAERTGVMLTDQVSYEQQLCNFKLRKVGFVFLSRLNSAYVPEPFGLVERYRAITAQTFETRLPDESAESYLLMLDKSAIEKELTRSGFKCRSFQLY